MSLGTSKPVMTAGKHRQDKGKIKARQSMFAVIVSGGKQHRVIQGEVLRVEKLDASVGETVEFDQVLVVGEQSDLKIGRPYLADGKVLAEIIKHGKADKITVVKFRRRKGYRRKQGHRQCYTEIRVTGISG